MYRQDSAGNGYDNAQWISTNATLGTTQPFNAVMAADGTVYAGFQDNGTAKIDPDGKAREVYGGDGFDVAVEPDNANHAYEEYTYGAMNKTADGGRTWISIAPTFSSTQFATPFEMDPRNKNHLVITGREIYETLSGISTTANTWSLSYDLGPSPTPGVNNEGTAVILDGTSVYVGYCGVCDVVTQGQGNTKTFRNGIATNVQAGCTPETGKPTCWHKTARSGLPNRLITDIAIDPNDHRTIFVTIGGYNRRWHRPAGDPAAGAGRGHLFVSHDAGETFADVSGNLPDSPANAVLLRAGRVFVGTDVGVFSAPVGTGAFTRIGGGLPNAQVMDINLDPQGSRLVAATHGRGIWVYSFGAAAGPTPPAAPVPPTSRLPATGGDGGLALAGAVALAAGLVSRRRVRRIGERRSRLPTRG